MKRTLLVLALLLAVVPGAFARTELKYSGTVANVEPDRRTLTIEEMIAWTGPGTGVVKHTVTVTDATNVQLVVRDPTDFSRPDRPGFREMPFKLSDLAPGDFVTVTTEPDRPVAVSIEVWRPSE